MIKVDEKIKGGKYLRLKEVYRIGVVYMVRA
jgi:hypothetical protein